MTQALFEGFIEKIYYRLIINRNQSHVYTFMLNETLFTRKPYEIQDDDDVEYVMLVTSKKTRIDTTLHYKILI